MEVEILYKEKRKKKERVMLCNNKKHRKPKTQKNNNLYLLDEFKMIKKIFNNVQQHLKFAFEWIDKIL